MGRIIKTLVWGGNGFIGNALLDHNSINISHSSLFSKPGIILPDFNNIIWSAGWPGKKNIDDVEDDEVRSMLQNVWEPLEVINRCVKSGKRILIMSSGCLFDGLNCEKKPWKENEIPNFEGGVYHRHKKLLEDEILNRYGNCNLVTIFRFRLPFNGSRHSRNIIHKFAHFNPIMNIEQSFTWISDLKKATDAWRNNKIDGGIWHIVQPGTMNNYWAAQHLNPNVMKYESKIELGKCPRSFAILDCSKLNSIIELTPVKKAWKIACDEYLFNH